MFYVYLIRSEDYPDETHIGFTDNVQARLEAHNNGESAQTKDYKPWVLVSYVSFKEKTAAMIFESFLKTGAGTSFARKHFW